jgi:hypothetical protein
MNSIINALVRTGVAMTTSTLVTSTVHARMGIRNSVIPGARILKIVTRKLMAPRIELVPMRMRPTIHRSVPVPLYWACVSGGYSVQPAAAAPSLIRKPEAISSPPSGSSQNDSALIRGNAMSGAPIWSGTA